MKIGYIRASQAHPSDEQEAALRAASVERIYREEVITPRKPLAMMTEAARSLRQGETLIVTRLDRLGRTKREALDIIGRAHSKGATVTLLAEGIETTADMLAFGLALAEADRAWGAERGAKGVQAAAEILVQAVPWHDVEIGVRVVLIRERGALASRKYGEDATGWVARKVVENMRLSGYTVLAGPPTEMMSTPSGPKKDPP